MKRITLLIFTLVFGLAVAAVSDAAAQSKAETPQAQPAEPTKPAKPEGKPATLSGEVVDLNCYMARPAGATGAEHAKCANDCVGKGLAAGFLTPDGTLYVIVGSNQAPANPKVKDFVGKQSTITGRIMQHNGVKAIDLATIAEAKG
ncbi:MAG TPA: hypothetical protein VFT13_09045 [Candidatus Krumholzibacteria bacterium]|nr:hypothetical protein [Candidatus Krumholzibacteria bacterium]